ncbi:hypothetical protein FNF29_00117 [Cafeteria roenbergensis]|uniref:Uncharacterized protein n=1 Tax=Cafeteria roenbergensis TaxID=33653 RepID=A0A5A8E2H0_CAFRO|nr:hypothetical protein FNF29_00117 [Cafeteria roenbergensis]KAA0171962.1 hypothetical protein FNF28_00279 [Cafeteria roenbergensis]|eukprot:KAA0157541.1 hypothetical protein FNF29_00117 [Cafeteria roenbergensis]
MAHRFEPCGVAGDAGSETSGAPSRHLRRASEAADPSLAPHGDGSAIAARVPRNRARHQRSSLVALCILEAALAALQRHYAGIVAGLVTMGVAWYVVAATRIGQQAASTAFTAATFLAIALACYIIGLIGAYRVSPASDEPAYLQYVWLSLFWGFPDDIAVKIDCNSTLTTVQVHSQQRLGTNDFGQNRLHVEQILTLIESEKANFVQLPCLLN